MRRETYTHNTFLYTICIAAISQAQYLIDSWISLKKKSIPLIVQTMEGAVVLKTNLFLFHVRFSGFELRAR